MSTHPGTGEHKVTVKGRFQRANFTKRATVKSEIPSTALEVKHTSNEITNIKYYTICKGRSMLQVIRIVLSPCPTSAEVEIMQVSTVCASLCRQLKFIVQSCGVTNSNVPNHTSESPAYHLFFPKAEAKLGGE